MADQNVADQTSALDLILRNPENFGRTVVIDQIELRKNRLAQISRSDMVDATKAEIAALEEALVRFDGP